MKRKFSLFCILSATLILAMSACSSANSEDRAYKKAGYSEQKYYASDNETATEETATEGTGGFSFAKDEDAKIIWTGSVSMETTDWEKTFINLREIFSQYGVQVISSETFGGTSYETSGKTRASARNASYVVRVPSGSFEEFMESFSGVYGSVTSSSASSADRTKQYNENDLMLELLHTEYDDLKALLEKAVNVAEIMEIRDRMTIVLAQIRSLSNTNNQIDYDVDYSKISLYIREVVVYSDPEMNDSWFVRVGRSFIEGTVGFFGFLGNVAVWLIGHLFYLLLLAVAIWLPIFLIRRGNRRRRAKLESAKAEKAVKTAEGSDAEK